MQGDALLQLQLVKPESIDTVFTSPEPPVNYQELQEIENICLQLPRVLKQTGSIWINMSDYRNVDGYMTAIPERFLYDMIVEHDWKLMQTIIWHRNGEDLSGGFQVNVKRRFRQDHEYLYWFVKDKNDYYFDENNPYNSSTVITSTYIPQRPQVFESGFPLDLIAWTALSTCPPNGRILDPFTGTGSTGVVALEYGREFLGIEANPLLIPKLNDRLNKCITKTISVK